MAEAVKDYQKLEHDIIRLAGGADNIASAQRCATRLRLVLKNTPGQAETGTVSSRDRKSCGRCIRGSFCRT